MQLDLLYQLSYDYPKACDVTCTGALTVRGVRHGTRQEKSPFLVGSSYYGRIEVIVVVANYPFQQYFDLEYESSSDRDKEEESVPTAPDAPLSGMYKAPWASQVADML